MLKVTLLPNDVGKCTVLVVVDMQKEQANYLMC